MSGCDERTAFAVCFHHNHAVRQTADDPVAHGKMETERSGQRGILAEDTAAVCQNLLIQRSMRRRIHDIHTTAQHPHRNAARVHGTNHRHTVRAKCQSAHYDSPAGRQSRTERIRHISAVIRHGTCADHTDGTVGGRVGDGPAIIQDKRRVGETAQAGRKRRIVVGQDSDGIFLTLIQNLGGAAQFAIFEKLCKLQQIVVPPRTIETEVGILRLIDRLRVLVFLKQLCRQSTALPESFRQPDPIDFRNIGRLHIRLPPAVVSWSLYRFPLCIMVAVYLF